MATPSGAAPAPGEVVVTPLDGSHLSKCLGARPTPGSENTGKRLVGGDLVPGGTAEYEISFPFATDDDNGRQDFVILDCVFLDDEPVLAFEITGTPNDVSPFVFRYTIDIPDTATTGSEVCNVAKTTAGPSAPQGSNRKAGEACFTLGGELTVRKVDPAGAPLTGATFSVVCTTDDDIPAVTIENEERTSFTGTTGTDNEIAIAGPEGTSCVITETNPPTGYSLATPASVTAVIGDTENDEVTFVNPRATGSLVITKATTGGSGTFTFGVDCEPGSTFDQTVTITDSGTQTIADIPTGTVCTVSENAAPGFAGTVVPAGGTVTIETGANTVAFSNVRETGTLVVAKTTVGGTGTFTFVVDCNPGTAFDQTFTLTNTETRRIGGIPTGTTCVVTEAPTTNVTSAVTPGNGTVTIATGDNTVSFTNTVRLPVLQITKTADAPSVIAGSVIGFSMTVANTGPGTATAVTLHDALPGGAGIAWSVAPAYTGSGTCSISGSAPAQVLVCSVGDLAPGASRSVHVSSATTAASTGTLSNTAVARAADHGPVEATATVTVNAAIVAALVVPPAVQAEAVTQQATPPAAVEAAVVARAAPPAAVQEEALPRTGMKSLSMAIAGAMFILLGVAMRRWGVGHRRRSALTGR